MTISKDAQINYINIGLMVLSMIGAYILPFEVFLFAYAFLGPLHYLTEISWLHDRQYFAKGKFDFVPLLIIGVVLSYYALASEFDFHENFVKSFRKVNMWDILTCLALISSILFVFVKNLWVKLFAILFLYIFLYKLIKDNESKEGFTIFALISLVPTLIHVYIFTGLFMLYGALKSRSSSGLFSVVVFAIVPFILIKVFPDESVVPISDYGKKAYYADGKGFFNTNVSILNEFGLDTIDTEESLSRTIIKNYTVVNVIDEFEKERKHHINGKLILKYRDSLNSNPESEFVLADKVDRSKLKSFSYNDFSLFIQSDTLIKSLLLSGEFRSKRKIQELNDRLVKIYNKDAIYEAKAPVVFDSTIGLLLMRFIAFAYLYHYLNWFSKTEVIKWHKVPKKRFIVIVALWLIACGLYIYNYAIGLTFLFFLSFTHVLLEFPLNILSILELVKK